MKKYYILVLSLIIFTIFSCSKEEVIEPQVVPGITVPEDFSAIRAEILADLGRKVIQSNNQNLKSSAYDLNSSAQLFTVTPNLSNLLALQEKWKIVQNQWELNCLYNLGPVKDQYLFYKIDTWPTNMTFINNTITGSDSIDNGFIESRGASSKGLPAIENIVFDLDNGNQTVLDNFNTSIDSYRRKQYLNALTINMYNQTIKIDSIWDESKGNYYSSFVLSTENKISSAFNTHMNNLIELLGYIVITKLEKPMGITSGTVTPTLAESYQSSHSFENINQNILTLKEGFNGSLNGIGIVDLLDDKNVKNGSVLLSESINQKFDSLVISLNNISSISVSDAVVNEPNQIISLLNHFKGLYDLMRIDVADAADVIVTFSGNDGD